MKSHGDRSDYEPGMAQLNELADDGRRMLAAGATALKIGLAIVALLIVALILLALLT